MITKRPARDGRVRVTFAMPATVWADMIHVVGDFNGWDEQATPLRQTEGGWMVTLELEAGRSYQYRYLFNGSEWHNDWHADSYAANDYGENNSVVHTPIFDEPAPVERVICFSAARRRLVSAS